VVGESGPAVILLWHRRQGLGASWRGLVEDCACRASLPQPSGHSIGSVRWTKA